MCVSGLNFLSTFQHWAAPLTDLDRHPTGTKVAVHFHRYLTGKIGENK